eukprot:589387-Amphidinium_carterae.1
MRTMTPTSSRQRSRKSNKSVDESQRKGLLTTTTQRRHPNQMGNTIKTRRKDKTIESTKVNLDEIYAATPRILRTIAQLKNHSIYMSDIQSAFRNTPVQPGTTILVKPPPESFLAECEQDDSILWKLNKQLYGLRDSPQKFQQHLSTTKTPSKPILSPRLRLEKKNFYTGTIQRPDSYYERRLLQEMMQAT